MSSNLPMPAPAVQRRELVHLEGLVQQDAGHDIRTRMN